MAKLNAARSALKEEARSLALKRASQEARLAKLQAVACIRNRFFSGSGSYLKRHSVSGSFSSPSYSGSGSYLKSHSVPYLDPLFFGHPVSGSYPKSRRRKK
jgi:hypothetical protein